MSEVDELKKRKNQSYTIGWLLFSQESEAYINNQNNCFGFVEGECDLSFYNQHINNLILQYNGKVNLYYSGGKRGVMYAYEQISNNYDNEIQKKLVFFRDKDLSNYINDPYLFSGKNVYVTDEYSIENSFINEDVLHRIMHESLGYSRYTREEIEQKIAPFTLAMNDFKRKCIKFMAVIIYWNNNGHTPNLQNVKIDRIINIEQSSVEFMENFEETFSESCGCPERKEDFNEPEVLKIEQSIKEDIGCVRGHFIAQFFVRYINNFISGRINSETDINNIVVPRSSAPNSLQIFIENTLAQYYQSLNSN